MDKKRLLLIVLFAIAVAGIAYALYYVFLKKPAAPPTVEKAAVNAPVTGLPVAKEGPPVPTLPLTVAPLPKAAPTAQGGLTKTTALTAGATLFSTVSADGKNVNYYDPSSGKFFRVTPDGQIAPLSSQIFADAKKVTWSTQNDKAILEFPDNSKILYNFTTQKQVSLPKHWTDFAFSAASDKIAAKSIGVSPENRWLVTANPDGSETKIIEALGNNADKVQINWSPAGGVIAFADIDTSLGFGRKQIIPLGPNNENYRPLIVEGFSFEPKWTPGGSSLIYSTFSPDTDYKPTLWFTNAQGDDMGANRHKLNINTWADKCVFADNDTLYCAVPDQLEKGIGFAPELANSTPDTLYKVDVKTNLKTVVAVPEGNLSMKNLIISADKSALYFTNNATGQLHQIKLK